MIELRLFFDAGAGVCLWAGNGAARERFGYAVAHGDLPLSVNTKRWLDHLVAWFDTSLDWDNAPAQGAYWTAEEAARFRVAASAGLAMVRRELGDGFTVYEDRGDQAACISAG